MHETVKNRIEQLPQAYQELLATDLLSVTVQHFASELGLDDETQKLFHNGLVLYFTWFINLSELKEFLVRECLLPETVAQDVADTMHDSLPEDIQKQIKVGFETINGNAAASQKEVTHSDLQKEIAETTESLQQIQSMRTMQTDHQKQSPDASQAKAAPSTPMPKNPTPQPAQPEKKESPRWGSDA